MCILVTCFRISQQRSIDRMRSVGNELAVTAICYSCLVVLKRITVIWRQALREGMFAFWSLSNIFKFSSMLSLSILNSTVFKSAVVNRYSVLWSCRSSYKTLRSSYKIWQIRRIQRLNFLFTVWFDRWLIVERSKNSIGRCVCYPRSRNRKCSAQMECWAVSTDRTLQDTARQYFTDQ